MPFILKVSISDEVKKQNLSGSWLTQIYLENVNTQPLKHVLYLCVFATVG